ncbi:hypothetical protein OSB04_006457 [Centaurea solstitialis]|uniref:Integrase catalytic domain-containing protein n=1 Tax=Centaurea solstitialis TaxID=347529 RepID=A0AA38U152_9ASTR|nr:hypothetical protein OSB04_006457 [Centaurea solstitialis]
MIDKIEVFRMFLSFVAMSERQFFQQVKIFQSDNGTVFNSLYNYFMSTGVISQTSCIGTPQQNGRVERKHRYLLNVARASVFQANLPIYLCGKEVFIATHLINRTPPCCLIIKGCMRFCMEERVEVFDLETNEFFFYETSNVLTVFTRYTKATNINPCTIFPYTNDVYDDFTYINKDATISDSTIDPPTKDTTISDSTIDPPTEDPPMNQNHQGFTTSNSKPDLSPPSPTTQLTAVEASMSHDESTSTTLIQSATENNDLGRGLCNKKSSVQLKDYVIKSVIASDNSIVSSLNTPYPLIHYIHCDKFLLSY